MANCEAKLKLNADCIGVVGVDSRSTSTDGVAGSWSTDGVGVLTKLLVVGALMELLTVGVDT